MKTRMMRVEDRELLSLWKYTNQYAGFNYALEKGGWLDLYCQGDCKYCFVVESEKELLGIFLFIPEKENEFRLLINPDYLNKGYGKALTSQALELAFRELAFSKVSLIVRKNHPIAINIYKNLGFNIIGESSELINGEETEFFKMVKLL